MHHEMPVTTKAQLSAETEDSANNVKRGMDEFLSKLGNLLKPATFLMGLLPLPAEPDRTKAAGSRTGGLFLCQVVFVIARRSNGWRNVAVRVWSFHIEFEHTKLSNFRSCKRVIASSLKRFFSAWL